jgi:hypothetical protein
MGQNFVFFVLESKNYSDICRKFGESMVFEKIWFLKNDLMEGINTLDFPNKSISLLLDF